MLCGCGSICVCVCVLNVVFFPCISSRPTPPSLSLLLSLTLSLLFHVALPETELATPQSSVCYFFYAICTFFFYPTWVFFYCFGCCWMFVSVCVFVPPHPALPFFLLLFRVHFPTKAIEGWMRT